MDGSIHSSLEATLFSRTQKGDINVSRTQKGDINILFQRIEDDDG